QQPAVPIRIVKGRERPVAAVLGIRPAYAQPPKQVWLVIAGVHAGGIVEHFADLDAATEQFVAHGVNAGDDQVKALSGAGRGRSDIFAEDHRASGAGRRELDYAEVAAVVVVGVEPPTELRVKILRAAGIRHGNHHHL